MKLISSILSFTLATLLIATTLSAAETKPAVLFYGYAPHSTYVAKPLQAMGIELDSCPAGQLAAYLGSNRYNVVVISTMIEAERQAVDAFLARGGGVLMCNPVSYPREEDFTKTCEWLAKLGARERWEMLKDRDPSNIVQVTFGSLTWTDQVSDPVKDGVRGLLTVLSGSTTGWEPPMSYDFSPDWTVTVRGAASLSTAIDPRNDPVLQPWIPKAAVTSSPALMGVRESGKGRLAVIPVRNYWIFAPPPNCPPAEAMLSYDKNGKQSDWLRLFANTFRWLAEPSLKAGIGGATTPAAILNPPTQAWDIPATVDWAKLVGPLSAQPDMPQNAGLIGARTALSSGSGTVADYVKAAREAGLKFIVFMEDSLAMDQAKWDQLVTNCAAASGDDFVAVPGLSYEDAQGNHLYVLGDKVLFPKPSMLLPDKRLNTAKANRCDMYFQYINELIGQKALTGFWHHKDNQIHWRDYKLYNSFPIVSFEDGKPVDNAFPEYLDWMGMGGCQAVMAFEVMSKPALVSERAKKGWRVIWNRDLKNLRDGTWHNGAWSFCGMGSQYISSGPSILVWSTPNNLVGPNGLWWRPDLWEYRMRLRVASDAGLKAVTLHDGNRQVLRRWLPAGAKTFEQDVVLANSQQLGLTLEVEDVNGGRAISMGYWNRNLNQEEFFCSDRCNILGSARLRLKRNGTQYWTPVGFQGNMGCTPSKARMDLFVQPAVGLTANSPTIPVDGQPLGLPPVSLSLNISVPGEIQNLFTTPATYMASPEIVVGQYGFQLAYDPAEVKAEKSPLGHAYEQPQQGFGNSWSSWHKLVPTRKISGWARLHACNWLTEGFRVGWSEVRLTVKEPVAVETNKGGLPIGYTQGVIYRDGKPVTGKDVQTSRGAFGRGVFSLMESEAGAVVVIGMGDKVDYVSNGMNLSFLYNAGKAELPVGEAVNYTFAFAGADGRTTVDQMLDFVKKFGVFTPGTVGYKPEIKAGKQIDNYLVWRLDGQGSGVDATIPKAAMPAFLTASVENLNDNWSVHFVDKARQWPNHRALPIRDGRTFAELDLNDADMDVFIGHPVTADQKDLKILVSWMEPGKWYVEAHNPTEKAMKVALLSNKAWPFFKFDEKLELPAGSSKIWTVTEK